MKGGDDSPKIWRNGKRGDRSLLWEDKKQALFWREHAENRFTLSINGMAAHQSIAHRSIDDRRRNDSMTLTADPLTFFTWNPRYSCPALDGRHRPSGSTHSFS